GEVIVTPAVVINRLTMHEPRGDVGKAAISERLVGFLDGKGQYIGWVPDIVTGRELGVQDHHVDGDLFGFECLALRIGKRRDLLFWRYGTGCRRAVEWRRISRFALQRWRMVRRQFGSVHLRQDMGVTAYIGDRK